jgi:uncharacterized protein
MIATPEPNTMGRITNIHSHVFTGGCAPDHFFKMVLPSWADRWAAEIKYFLEMPWMRGVVKRLARRRGNSDLLRYLQFIEVGTQSTQEEVFEGMRRAYAALGPDVRFVALTLNMDHMDVAPSGHARIDDQLAEVERVRAHYPDAFLPFVGVDPRHLKGTALRDWVRDKIERRAFFGIKIYPSLGFFPFDPALDALYEWAQEEQVPIMTHCTREGTHYTGAMREVLPHADPPTLNPSSPTMHLIRDRVARFVNSPFARTDAKYWGNALLHPQNYEPVLEKYPRLKLCLAHFGGDDQILGEQHDVQCKGLDTDNWHDEVLRLMDAWPQVYTDISYTLFRADAMKKILPLFDGPVGHRILFGTDYYMTLRERDEATLVSNCRDLLGPARFDRIAVGNTTSYLRSRYYDPNRPFSTAPAVAPAAPLPNKPIVA